MRVVSRLGSMLFVAVRPVRCVAILPPAIALACENWNLEAFKAQPREI